MDQYQLTNHVRKFGSRGDYLLEVECPDAYAGIWLSNRQLGFMLCKTALKSGSAIRINFYYFPEPEIEEVLFDSSCPELFEAALSGMPHP